MNKENYTDGEKEIIKKIYNFELSEVEADRKERFLDELSIGLDSREGEPRIRQEELESLVMKEIINENGDRLTINRSKLPELVKEGVINITDIIERMAYDSYYIKTDLRNSIEEIKNLKLELSSEIEEAIIKTNEVEVKVQKTQEKLEKGTINMIEVMGIFISLFTLISVNVNFLGIVANIEGVWIKIGILLTINITTLISVFFLLFFIRKFITDKK